ncbi:MAG: T9SS type A sorting domain-containing protein [Ignavibacteriales bacterium]|nr:T9SS type A sorting domain-containing protein [Ignavibacteriales bacterium]
MFARWEDDDGLNTYWYTTLYKRDFTEVNPDYWAIKTKVSNGQSDATLFFGHSPEGSDELDVILDEVELPPPPPIGTFDARFIFPNNQTSLKDYRSNEESNIIWLLKFQAGASGYPITFSWDSEQLPFGSFFLRDAITGSIINIDMKRENSYTLTNESINQLQIVFKEEHQSAVKNNSNWDLISIPLEADNMGVTALLPEANSSAFLFDGQYKSTNLLDNGVGYWVKFDSSKIEYVYGQEVSNPISVKSGWNMIGGYNEEIPLSNLITTPSGIISSSVYGFENGYFIADKLEVGNGYWVKSSQDGEISFTGSKALGKKSNKLELNTEPFISFNIIADDGVSDSISLTFGLDSLATDGYDQILGEEELPPLPPLGVFDIRIELPDTLITSYTDIRHFAADCYEHIISYQLGDSSKGLTLSWNLPEGVSLNISDLFGGSIFSEQFESGEGSFTITNTAVSNAKLILCYSHIILSNNDIEQIPIEYSLSQNYPNPFNPSTRIKFGIPKESKVSLVIYNILGQVVEKLVDQQLKAGYHEVEFNSSIYSSGIYFYRIQSGDFVETKKMILLK